MKLQEIQVLEGKLMKELVEARSLGGYSAEAGKILFLLEAVYKLTHHIRQNEEFPSATPDKDKKIKPSKPHIRGV